MLIRTPFHINVSTHKYFAIMAANGYKIFNGENFDLLCVELTDAKEQPYMCICCPIFICIRRHCVSVLFYTSS